MPITVDWNTQQVKKKDAIICVILLVAAMIIIPLSVKAGVRSALPKIQSAVVETESNREEDNQTAMTPRVFLLQTQTK